MVMIPGPILEALARQPRDQRLDEAVGLLAAAPTPAHVRLSLAHILAVAECAGALELLQYQAAGAPRTASPTVPSPSVADDAAPANLQDTPDQAARRMVTAVRAFIRRHYDGEIRARGFQFLFRIFADLLAMAYGAALVHQDDDQPDALPHDVQVWAEAAFAPWVEYYRQEQERAEARDRAPARVVGAPIPNRGGQWM